MTVDVVGGHEGFERDGDRLVKAAGVSRAEHKGRRAAIEKDTMCARSGGSFSRSSGHARQVVLGEDLGNELAPAARPGLVEDGFEVLLHG
jgi:hypothetical protein